MAQSENAQTVCPLCGGDNQCAIAAGKAAESCWCQEATISKEALAALPEEAVNNVCVCPECGRLTDEEDLAKTKANNTGGQHAG